MSMVGDASQGWTDHKTITATAFKRFEPVAIHVLCNLILTDPERSVRDASQTSVGHILYGKNNH